MRRAAERRAAEGRRRQAESLHRQSFRPPPSALRLSALVLVLLTCPARAQQLSQRGFVEARGTFYPQDTANDSTNAVANLLFREEASWRPTGWLTLAGAFEAQIDTHGRVEREWRLDWGDRGTLRPSLSARRLSAAVTRWGVTFEAGKQFVRWGKADVLNPTDRFAPRDFMEVVDNEFLGITAARLTWERKSNTVEAVWGRFTPSRVPLPTDRWAALSTPVGAQGSSLAGSVAARSSLASLGATFPTRSQVGLRWSHLASGFEFSLSAYDGFNHLPSFQASVAQGSSLAGVVAQGSSLAGPAVIQFSRFYPRMRMFGGDAAVPLRWITLKGEAGYFTSPDGRADEYGIYVLQVERQSGEWFFVAGYAGEVVGNRALPPPPGALNSTFALDRALAKSFLGRASYTIDVNRSMAFEGAVRQDGNGVWVKAEYSQAAGQHLRATARAHLIRGNESDFLGRYRLNSGGEAILRYSF